MWTKSCFYMVLCLAGIMLAATPLQSQIIYGQPGAGNLRVFYSHWSLEDDRGTTEINQLSIPINGFIPLRDNFETRFYITSSANNLTFADKDMSLAGLSDFRIQANRSFLDDKLLLSAGVNVPVGKKKLNQSEERVIVEILSENYLTFPTRRFGEGLGANILLGGAATVGSFRCGGGVMYQYNGSYDPYENVTDYDPGDFVSVNANGSLQTGKSMLSADIIFTYFALDRLGDEKVFKQSPQLDLRVGAGLKEERFDLGGNVRYLIRGRHTRYDAASGDIISQLKLYGNEFSISGVWTYYPSEKWYLAPTLETRLISGNEEDFDNSSIFGFGAAYGRDMGKNINFDAGFKYFIGSADGGDIDLTGFQITSGLTASF